MESKNIEIGVLNAYYGGLLTAHQSEIVRLYYDCDLTLQEIGEEYGISRQAVSEIISRAEKKLKEYESKLLLAKKLSGLKRSLEEIININDVTDIKKQLHNVIKDVKEI